MITKKKEWITTKELAKLKGVCDRAVRKSINDNKYVVRKVSRSYEILVTSVEENVREKLTEDEEKLIPTIEENYIVPEEQKQLALAKYDLVKKWNEYRYGKKDRTKARQEFIESYNLELLYKELFQKIGKVAIGTIYDWDKKLRNCDDNWHCLIKNYSFGVKTNKKSGLSEKEEEIFLSILLHPNQIKIGKEIKLTKTILEQRGVKKFSCDMTYRRFINNYKKEHYDTWVFAREGHKALHDKVLPYITRDISKLEVGDVIIGDGHKLAFQVINPYTGNPTRATMVAYQEWKSGAMVGFEIMLEENKQCVASALRNAIITLGKVPKYVYHDNGKSFKAKYFIENGLSGIFANLGIEAIFAKAYNAKAKPIERFFKEFQETFEQLMPSYTGISIEQKPDVLREYKQEKYNSGYSVSSVKTYLALVKSIITHACPYKEQMAKQLEILSAIDMNILDKSQIEKLLSLAKREFKWGYPIIRLGLLSGANVPEILALQWENVFFSEKRIHISKFLHSGKIVKHRGNSPFRNLTIDNETVKTLAELFIKQIPSKEDFVCKVDNIDDINKYFEESILKPIYEKLELGEFNSIDLTHNFVNMLLTQNVPITYIRKVCGYPSIKTFLEVYNSRLQESEKEYYNPLDMK